MSIQIFSIISLIFKTAADSLGAPALLAHAPVGLLIKAFTVFLSTPLLSFLAFDMFICRDWPLLLGAPPLLAHAPVLLISNRSVQLRRTLWPSLHVLFMASMKGCCPEGGLWCHGLAGLVQTRQLQDIARLVDLIYHPGA